MGRQFEMADIPNTDIGLFYLLSTKSQAPAFAEAASRRQAKLHINPNHQNPNGQIKRSWSLGN
jgi:hypothetical protein